MDAFLNIGFTVLTVLGIVILLMGSFLLTLMSVFAFKIYKFMKKQKAIFDVAEKITSIKWFGSKK
ncbi:hypothetical protein MZM54_04600 [[Brevibacterium] frigoritolerans]|nr:hypothetical protein [Peribacillus frigoritolerans]